jgi:hypothetical protein
MISSSDDPKQKNKIKMQTKISGLALDEDTNSDENGVWIVILVK